MRKSMSEEVDFWGMINWLFVSFYWTSLSEVGQISPTTYKKRMRGAYCRDFDQPTALPPTNIFINATLFDIYSSYFRKTIIPALNYSSPRFRQLDENNRLHESERTFIRTYSCLERRIKMQSASLFRLLVSV
jgi:hypothetical protein